MIILDKIKDKEKDQEQITDFPKPFPLSESGRIRVWDEDEINFWMEKTKEKFRKDKNFNKNKTKEPTSIEIGSHE